MFLMNIFISTLITKQQSNIFQSKGEEKAIKRLWHVKYGFGVKSVTYGSVVSTFPED